MRRHLSEEDPPEEEDKEEGDDDDGGILADQEIEVDLSCGLPVSFGGFLQGGTHVAHFVKGIASVKQIFDVLGHDLFDADQLLVQLVQVVLDFLVAVAFLGHL